MKRLFLIATLVVLTTTQAFAAERYFSLATGAWFPGHTNTVNNSLQPFNISYNTGWSIGGAVGVAMDNGLRLENELVYRQASARGTGDDQWALGWMVNAWWDARNSTKITPYFGGGFGFGRGHASSPGPVDNDITGVAYQAGGGVDIRLDRSLSVDLGYRYFGISDMGNHGSGSDLSGSSVMAGMRLKF